MRGEKAERKEERMMLGWPIHSDLSPNIIHNKFILSLRGFIVECHCGTSLWNVIVARGWCQDGFCHKHTGCCRKDDARIVFDLKALLLAQDDARMVF